MTQSHLKASELLEDSQSDALHIEANYFPIRELSLKTGVNSVTLRAWERRYGLLKPKRTSKGHRLYDHNDVQVVEAILRWIQQGVAVSKVRALLEKGVTIDNVAPSNEWLVWQTALVEAATSFQEEKIERLYQQIFSQYPAEIAVRDWLLPSLERLGKGAELAFCESIILSCLVSRVSTAKMQPKTSRKVLITGLASQRSLWCYMAAAILLDKGLGCFVAPNVQHSNDWLTLLEGVEACSALFFCEGDLAVRSAELVQQMHQWNKPIAVIGASFWLAVNELGEAELGAVKVYSEPLEGVMQFLGQIDNKV